MPALTKRHVDSLAPRPSDYFVWDDALPGFGVRVWPAGRKVFVAQYRVGKRTKRLKIGNYGALTIDEARKLAKAALGDVAKGEDPQAERATRRKSLTVAQLCDDYLQDADRGQILGKYNRPKRESTLVSDRGRILRHIKPLLGDRLVIDLTPNDVRKFINDVTVGRTAVIIKTNHPRGKANVRGGAGTASRTAGLLGGILSYAVIAGIIATNPATGVKRPPNKKSTRRLSPEEYAMLGRALNEAEHTTISNYGLKALRALTLTGCRRGEIAGLRWSEVDVKCQAIRLQNTKEGFSVRPIGTPAIDLLRSMPPREGSEFVFPATYKKKASYKGLPSVWQHIAATAGFVDVTMHTLRHSYASVAADLGYAESTIAALLGHASKTMTSSYVHHLDSVLVAAANRVSQTIQLMMDGVSFERASGMTRNDPIPQ